LSGDIDDILLLDVTPLSPDTETMDGVSTSIIERNATIPTKNNAVFSTSVNNQTAVDANGLLNAFFKDYVTGKEQDMVLTAPVKLPEENIKSRREEHERLAAEDAQRARHALHEPPLSSVYTKKKNPFPIIAGCAIVLLFVIVLYSIVTQYPDEPAGPGSIPTESPLTPPPPPTLPLPSLPITPPPPVVVEFPPNGHIETFGSTLLNAIIHGAGPLEIRTPRGDDYYYIMLRDHETREHAMSIFVHPGETVETFVPLGRYEMIYATGKVWYGTEHLFGSHTEHHRALSVLHFYEEGDIAHGHLIELIRQVGGNMPSTAANADDFALSEDTDGGAEAGQTTVGEYALEALLFGNWEWDVSGDYILAFNNDGTGIRGFSTSRAPFTWSTPEEGHLIIFAEAIIESWTFTIISDVLTIDSRQVPGMEYSYIRQ
jgi:hypothetical protein